VVYVFCLSLYIGDFERVVKNKKKPSALDFSKQRGREATGDRDEVVSGCEVKPL